MQSRSAINISSYVQYRELHSENIIIITMLCRNSNIKIIVKVFLAWAFTLLSTFEVCHENMTLEIGDSHNIILNMARALHPMNSQFFYSSFRSIDSKELQSRRRRVFVRHGQIAALDDESRGVAEAETTDCVSMLLSRKSQSRLWNVCSPAWILCCTFLNFKAISSSRNVWSKRVKSLDSDRPYGWWRQLISIRSDLIFQ
jgi:hypothetical protein